MNSFQRVFAKAVSVLLLAGAFVVVSAARADAGLILYICNDASCVGGGDLIIADDGFGDVNNTTLGSIVVAVPGITLDFATTYPFVGSPTEPYLSLSYGLSAAGFAQFGPTPYIYAAQDGFLGLGVANFDVNSSNSGGTGFLFTGAGSFLPATAGPPDISCVLNCEGSLVVGAAPYYFAVGVAPTQGPSGFSSGDATVTVPVPDGGSTAALLGTVLVGFGMLRRRFRKN